VLSLTLGTGPLNTQNKLSKFHHTLATSPHKNQGITESWGR
jgi:hypothetical protein